jgi:hypothetical protein
MTSPQYIPPADEQGGLERPPDSACQSCGWATPDLQLFDIGTPPQPFWLCELCANTAAGNAMAYPYGQVQPVLTAICYVGNAIIAEIRKSRA